MPLLDLGADVIAKTKAKASVANFKWDAIKTLLNVTKLDADNIQDGSITEALLADALKTTVGIGSAARGKSIISGAPEVRVNVAYGLMPTPDRVQNVVLPTDGLLRVYYNATWSESVTNAARAAIFVGANQIKRWSDGANAPAVLEAFIGTNAASSLLTTDAASGLVGDNSVGFGYGGDVTTGQIVGRAVNGRSNDRLFGGAVTIFAAAGTYDISVQYKASSGSVSVSNRKLWVEAIEF